MPHGLSDGARSAILSIHSHGDRSFLDDRELAVLSGDLRREGLANDLVVALLDPRAEENPDGNQVLDLLVETLAAYEIVIYERVWSRGLVAALRSRLPDQVFVHCRGEHELGDPPADYVCQGELRGALPQLVAYLVGRRGTPPPGTRVREGERWVQVGALLPESRAERPFEPNLEPIVINPSALPEERSFAVLGNAGCPYQADARQNPAYAGVTIPVGYGRGCAFCTTGNHYDARPVEHTRRSVLEQIVAVRRRAPQIGKLVLKDQNPFGWLTEVVAECGRLELGAFTLLLETRADWFVKNERRFEQALAAAREAGIGLAPYLVGIESFSQRELDRMNKGIRAETNVRFLNALWSWKARFGPALDLGHAAFGFVLFTPWTSFDDLRDNLDGIRRTRLSELRGRILLSRARLYPDTALYYLAEKDGLLLDAYRTSADDAAARYGYFPARPWRFRDERVARFAEIATVLSEETAGKDEVRLFEHLLEAFARSDAPELDEIRRGFAERGAGAVPDVLRQKLVALLHPLDVERGFSSGWTLGPIALEGAKLRLTFAHAQEAAFVVDVRPRGAGPRYARSRHYDVSYASPSLTASQESALVSVCRALRANDP